MPKTNERFECLIFFKAKTTDGKNTKKPKTPSPLIFSKLFPISKNSVSGVIRQISGDIPKSAIKTFESPVTIRHGRMLNGNPEKSINLAKYLIIFATKA